MAMTRVVKKRASTRLKKRTGSSKIKRDMDISKASLGRKVPWDGCKPKKSVKR